MVTKSAAHNYNRGMLEHLIGATFVLAIIKIVWLIALSTFMALMYTTPAYSNSDASQNPCNAMDVTSKSFGKYLLGISQSRRT